MREIDDKSAIVMMLTGNRRFGSGLKLFHNVVDFSCPIGTPKPSKNFTKAQSRFWFAPNSGVLEKIV